MAIDFVPFVDFDLEAAFTGFNSQNDAIAKREANADEDLMRDLRRQALEEDIAYKQQSRPLDLAAKQEALSQSQRINPLTFRKAQRADQVSSIQQAADIAQAERNVVHQQALAGTGEALANLTKSQTEAKQIAADKGIIEGKGDLSRIEQTEANKDQKVQLDARKLVAEKQEIENDITNNPRRFLAEMEQLADKSGKYKEARQIRALTGEMNGLLDIIRDEGLIRKEADETGLKPAVIRAKYQKLYDTKLTQSANLRASMSRASSKARGLAAQKKVTKATLKESMDVITDGASTALSDRALLPQIKQVYSTQFKQMSMEVLNDVLSKPELVQSMTPVQKAAFVQRYNYLKQVTK